jgi:Rha family phage regulatory protein
MMSAQVNPAPTLALPSVYSSCAPLVHLQKGRAVTNSLTIASEFQRAHKNVLQSLDALIAGHAISRLDFKPRNYIDERGKNQRMIELTERGALIAMPFIGGRNSRAGQVRLVDAFLALRAELNIGSTNWSKFRQNASVGYTVMCDALHEVRTEAGKTTSSCHFANEAKLVNWVLFGRFEGVERDRLERLELVLLEKLELRNAIWIARGLNYQQRKEALPGYLRLLRAQCIEDDAQQ